MIVTKKNLLYGLAQFTLLGYVLLTYRVPRSDFLLLATLYGGLFIFYGTGIFLYTGKSTKNLPSSVELLLLALVFRACLLGAIPNLSDDFYRFYWDGKLLSQGFNPYLYLPADLIQTTQAKALGLTPTLFTSLNSPDYYTVYPPVNQLFFTIAALCFPTNEWGAVIVMRLFILLAETGTLILLPKLLTAWKLPASRTWLYAFNPLVIIEFTGNLHFEAIVLFFFLLAIYSLQKYPAKPWLSAFFYALAICTKLIPLLFLPLFFRQLGKENALRYYLWTGGFTLLFFLPFLSLTLIQNFFTSLDLYFQKFEFNASIYYLVREVGFWLFDNNVIMVAGVVLSLITLFTVVYMAIFLPQTTFLDFFTRALLALSLHYFLATTVHPWYIGTLVLLSTFTPYRFALWWSGTAVWSYATYQTTAYQENFGLVALEYIVVYSILILELRKNNEQFTEKPLSKP